MTFASPSCRRISPRQVTACREHNHGGVHLWVLQGHIYRGGLCHAGKQPPFCALHWPVFAVILPS